MGGAWLASVDSPTLSEGIMKYFLSVLIPFGFVHPKPQGFDFTNNCRGGAICNTDIDIQKTIQIFRGGTMFGSTGGRGGGGEFGQGGGAPSGGAGGGRITIPARPSLEGDCNYDCSGWPYAQCQMSIESQFRSASATCINPFPRGSSTKYSNYPECAQVPDGCERCDDVCAYRDGRRNRLSY